MMHCGLVVYIGLLDVRESVILPFRALLERVVNHGIYCNVALSPHISIVQAASRTNDELSFLWA
jgi:hypothetical protein